jgi:hypothetical protein
LRIVLPACGTRLGQTQTPAGCHVSLAWSLRVRVSASISSRDQHHQTTLHLEVDAI